MSAKRESWGPDHHPSYRKKLPEPVVVLLRDEDGTLLDAGEVCSLGFELTQEILAQVWGQMAVQKASYIEIRREGEDA